MLDRVKGRREGSRDTLMVCDLTQSYSPNGGGGISTYLREKRDYVLNRTPHHLLQIVPGPEDRVNVKGRHIFAEVGADPVRGSPNYRFILRTGVVRDILARYRPDIIESLCPWVLPWTAIHHRRAFPKTALVAGYRTDFPNAHVYRVARAKFGDTLGRGFRWLSYGYAEITYREFDWVYTLSEEARQALARRKILRTDILPLGVDTELFSPAARDPAYRAELGLGGKGPLLVYAGRLDNEKRADRLIAMVGEVSSAESRAGVVPKRVGSFGQLPAILATPLSMVLTELLQNAIEHGVPDGSGTVEVEVRRLDQQMRIAVADDGAGLPSGFSLATSPRLGLQIVRTLVEGDLGGRIELQPRPDGGTRAVIYVPLPAAD